MAQAYILLQTEVGRAGAVARAVAAIPGVVSAVDVTGPYDVVVHVESDTPESLHNGLLTRIKAAAGVTRTITCPVGGAPAGAAE